MRVIAGDKRGHRLVSPRGLHTRPTADRMREDLFNIIEVRPEDNFLDLFAGSGSVGIEARSRGAKSSTFIEIDMKAFDVLKENLARTDYDDSIIIRSSVEDGVKNLSKNKKMEPYDIVFLDPPYNQGFIEPTLDLIYETEIVKKGGLVIVEADIKEEFSTKFELLREKEYRYASLLIYRF